MAGREHEAVAVEPVRVGRVVLHQPRVEQVRDRRERHGSAGMAGVRLLDRVHRERADGVDAELVEVRRGGGGGHSAPWIDVVLLRGSIARPLLSCEHPGPDHSGIRASAGQRDRDALPQRRESARSGLVHRAVQVQLGRVRQAAADHDVLGLEHVHVAGHGHAEHAREAVEHPQGVGVALPRRGHERPPAHPAALVQSGREPAVRHVPGELRGVALQRLPAAVGLEASAARAVARTRRAVGVQREVAELRAHAVRAAEDLAADHHPAAHAGAEREHQKHARRGVVHELGLGQRRAVGVVVHVHGHLEAAEQLLPERHPGERDVHARLHGAGGVLDLGGHPHAHRHRRPGGVDHPARGGLEAVQQSLRAVQHGGRLLQVLGAPVHHRGHGHLGAADIHSENQRLAAHRGILFPRTRDKQART